MGKNKEHLIVPFLQGKLSPEELKEFELWRDQADSNKTMVEDCQKVWRLVDGGKMHADIEPAAQWQKITSAIEHEPDIAPVNSRTPQTAWLRYAASLLLVLMSSAALFLVVTDNAPVVVQTADNIINVRLPDGSELWLNRNSSVTYNEDFEDERTLSLTGEGFFDVRTNPVRPFIIKASSVAIEVLGTSFNVNAYDSSAETEVFVVSGTVSVETIDRTQKIILKPGSTGILNVDDNTLVTDEKENLNSLAWRNKQLVFKKTPLLKVLKALRSYFGKDIHLANPQLGQCRFTGSFDDPNLEQVFETLRIALDLDIKVKDDGYTLDGNGCDEN
jgi:transmembrane sensor